MPSHFASLMLVILAGGSGCGASVHPFFGGTDDGSIGGHDDLATRRDDGGSTSSGLHLTIQDAKQDDLIGGTSPGAGNVYLDVGVTLTNTGESKPLPANAALYSLRTASSLVYQSLATSALLTPACPAAVSVAIGGMVSCRIAFEIGRGEVPGTVTYADPTGRMAWATVPAVYVPPPQCQPKCSGATPWCNDQQRCVACLIDTQCAPGNYCSSQRCIAGCINDGNCGVGRTCQSGMCR